MTLLPLQATLLESRLQPAFSEEPAEAGTPTLGLHFRRIPFRPEIQKRVLAPALFGLRPPDLVQIRCRVRVRPVLPALDVPVPHRVMEDVVQRRPEVAFRFYPRFDRPVPDLSPPTTVLPVPAVRRPAVQFSYR